MRHVPPSLYSWFAPRGAPIRHLPPSLRSSVQAARAPLPHDTPPGSVGDGSRGGVSGAHGGTGLGRRQGTGVVGQPDGDVADGPPLPPVRGDQ